MAASRQSVRISATALEDALTGCHRITQAMMLLQDLPRDYEAGEVSDEFFDARVRSIYELLATAHADIITELRPLIRRTLLT